MMKVGGQLFAKKKGRKGTNMRGKDRREDEYEQKYMYENIFIKPIFTQRIYSNKISISEQNRY